MNASVQSIRQRQAKVTASLSASRRRPVIARIWHGTTLSSTADDYLAFLQARAVPDYNATPGNLSVDILRREAGRITHFVIVTHWESWDAVEAFAGKDMARAKYYPEDDGYLLGFEANVEHYEAHHYAT